MSQDMLFDHTLNCVLLPVARYTYGKCDNGDVYLKRIYFHNYCCGVCGKSGVYYDRISETQGRICIYIGNVRRQKRTFGLMKKIVVGLNLIVRNPSIKTKRTIGS